MKSDWLKIAILFCVSLLIFLTLTQCETEGIDYENINCADCYVVEPQLSYLIIHFSEELSDSVKFIVYRGYEGDFVEWEGWAKESPFYLEETPVNNLYTVKATYQIDTASIGVVDSDKLETHYIKGICDENCYIIGGGEYDVQFEHYN